MGRTSLTAGGRIGRGLAAAGGRVRAAAGTALFSSIAAALAWTAAHLGLGHKAPYFAPTAACVCLAVGKGGRGQQAVAMLAGVLVGMGVGELFLPLPGPTILRIVPSVLVAMLASAALGLVPVMLIQGAATALVVVASGIGGTGLDRLLDALTGGAVALLVSQVLLPPDPAAVLGQAARTLLAGVADGLRRCAGALAARDPAQAGLATERLRDAASSLNDLRAAQATARGVLRWTRWGRRKARAMGQLEASLDDLDLLHANALVLSRSVQALVGGTAPIPPTLIRLTERLGHLCHRLGQGLEPVAGSGDALALASAASAAAIVPATPPRPT